MAALQSLDWLLEPFTQCFDESSARRVLEFRVPEETQQRVEYLANQANEGNLSEDERAEYLALVDATDMIAVLKVKAKRRLDHLAA